MVSVIALGEQMWGQLKRACGMICAIYCQIYKRKWFSMDDLDVISSQQRKWEGLNSILSKLVLTVGIFVSWSIGVQQSYLFLITTQLSRYQYTHMQLLRIVRNFTRFSTQVLRTQIFDSLTNKQLATPELIKRKLEARIPFHSRVSLVSLYHGKRVRHAIKSCFSEKKSNRFKRVHKLKKFIYSEILGVKLYIRMSNKAYRCIKKMGSFDRYILLTPPEKLDSKIGEYYRTLMMRKINDPQYRVPYVIGSGKKQYIHKHQRYRWLQQGQKMIIPKDFRKNLQTLQRKFGTSVDQLNEEDYKKYLEVQRLKKLWGKDMDTRHPLLLQIESKINVRLTDQEISAMQERAEQYKRQYLQHPKNRELRQQSFEYNEREGEKEHLKVKQAWLKHLQTQAEDADVTQTPK